MESLLMRRSTRINAIVAMILACTCAAFAQVNKSAKINELLNNVKSHAMLATHDAELLESYARSDMSWQSHANQINLMKTHVNDLIKDHNDMIAVREGAFEWQKRAIDRTDPLVKEIADRLNAMINHLNDNKDKTKMQAYKDYVHSNYELISSLDKMVSDFVDYEEAKSKADGLEEKLELTSSSGESH